MSKLIGSYYRPYAVQRGFSLVELIIIVIILGILSITVAPRFMDARGFSEYAYQTKLESALRKIQLQAMQDSRPNICVKMNFVNGSNGSFGIPTEDFSLANAAATCANSIDYNSADYKRTDVSELQNASLVLQATDSGNVMQSMQFTSMGKPISDVGACADTCVIAISGLEQASVCIESQGYVHAC